MFLLFDINIWWSGLGWSEKIYWFITLLFTTFFVFQVMFGMLGDHDHQHVEHMDDSTDHGLGFRVFTFKNLIAFFTLMGWSGLACLQSGLNIYIVIGISVICGFLMMLLMAALYYFAGKMTQSGTLNIEGALDKIGETYIPIPSQRKGMGKIQLKLQGSFREMDAITDDLEDIPTGAEIKVLQIVNNQILLVTTKTHLNSWTLY